MSSTNFTVPKGVKKIDCFCVGGGGNGGTAEDGLIFTFNGHGGSGGGGGYTKTTLAAEVNPGQQIAVVVGTGGQPKFTNSSSISKIELASSSSIGSICSANGGVNGTSTITGSIDGGSGGGSGVHTGNGSDGSHAGFGGSDGSDSQYYHTFSGTFTFTCGKGQHTTTRYFGESTGTLYAGGGGGGGTNAFRSSDGRLKFGIGGEGGGGNGSLYHYDSKTSRFIDIDPDAEDGATNTGGGAGGRWAYYPNGVFPEGKTGGSGICIIRWTKDYFK